VNTLRDLKVYPNPFVYSKHDEVIIDDLSDQTTIKIVGADGSVFNSFQTKGGRHSWDGLDEYGKELSSGVYFVVAIADNGSEKGIGKIVIIR
jgi:flagellar hook assembly protein FlgD